MDVCRIYGVPQPTRSAVLALDPTCKDIHRFKIAGTAETFSFPPRPFVTLMFGPRVWLALLLALVAALVNSIPWDFF